MSSSAPTDGSFRRANRLSRESSPYLLAHQFNPVDWHGWGDEAFSVARQRDVPVFLSIGYSTCYWCHVMERESFENESIARLMNEHFVCVKVDREERPEIDDLYMAAVQAFSGRGGWPMSVFLEPARRMPFWAGTYFPNEEKPGYGIPSFPRVLHGMSSAWREQREEVMAQADKLAAAVAERLAQGADAPRRIGADQVTRAVGELIRLHDRRFGGFGGSDADGSPVAGPKFPQTVFLDLLIEARSAAGDDATREAIDAALKKSLDAMSLGGIHDQIGGGFHRYSVDPAWVVPHFEKMLYDQALLLGTYAAASRLYGDAWYRRVCQRIVAFVDREMTARDRDGKAIGFFSALDAEVDGREGMNYVWTPGDLQVALHPSNAPWAQRVFNVSPQGNFHDPHHPMMAGESPRSVLTLAERPEQAAARLGASTDEYLDRLERVSNAMLGARDARPRPRLDDKMLASWNALMIQALADAGRLLDRRDWIEHAGDVADWVLKNLRLHDGSFARSKRGDRCEIPAVLEDYAAMIAAVAALARADAARRPAWLDRAEALAADCLREFADADGVYDTRRGRRDLFVRPRTVYDGATPSGVSLLINGLLDLALAFEAAPAAPERGARMRRHACWLLKSVSGYLASSPTGGANSTRGLLRAMRFAPTELGQALEDLDAEAPAQPPHGEDRPASDVVEVLSELERVEVGAQEPGLLMLRLRVAAGFHVYAADPTPGHATNLAGLRVGLTNGTGVRVYADYPVGEQWQGSPEIGSVRVYRGEVDLRVVLEREGAWSGQPVLTLRYQACSDRECLPVRIVELDVGIDRK